MGPLRTVFDKNQYAVRLHIILDIFRWRVVIVNNIERTSGFRGGRYDVKEKDAFSVYGVCRGRIFLLGRRH